MLEQNAILEQNATSPPINKPHQKKISKKTMTTSLCCHHQASPTKQNTKRKGDVPKDTSKQNMTLEQSAMMEAFWEGSIMRRNIKAKPPSKVC